MTAITSTGTIVSISAGPPVAFDQASFELLTYSVIGELTNVPAFGPNVQVVEHNPLGTGITEKFKGFINYGSSSLEAAYDPADPGQVIAEDGVVGSAINTEHSFKLEYQDGSVKYWTGKLFSYTQAPSSANSMVTTTMQMEINTPILSAV